MKLIAVPAEAYDMARGDLFFAGAISVGWLVAGMLWPQKLIGAVPPTIIETHLAPY